MWIVFAVWNGVHEGRNAFDDMVHCNAKVSCVHIFLVVWNSVLLMLEIIVCLFELVCLE